MKLRLEGASAAFLDSEPDWPTEAEWSPMTGDAEGDPMPPKPKAAGRVALAERVSSRGAPRRSAPVQPVFLDPDGAPASWLKCLPRRRESAAPSRAAAGGPQGKKRAEQLRSAQASQQLHNSARWPQPFQPAQPSRAGPPGSVHAKEAPKRQGPPQPVGAPRPTRDLDGKKTGAADGERGLP